MVLQFFLPSRATKSHNTWTTTRVSAHVPPYFEVPHNVTEIMTHLIRAGLEQWCPAMHEAAARRGIHTSIDQARKAFDEQAKFYPALLRMKRMQRGWIEFTRRKYDVMLPAVTSYGR